MTGAASITSPVGTATPLTGGVVLGAVSVSGSAGVLPFGAIDLIDNSSGPVNIVGPGHVITVVGAGNLFFGNQGQGAQVFLTNGNNKFAAFDNSSATVNVDSGSNLVWDYGTGTAETINGYNGSSILIARGHVDSLLGGVGGGAVLVNALAGLSTYSQQTYNPSATVPALTISGAAGANFQYYAGAGTNAFLNPGSGNVTVLGTVSGGGGGGGSVTLFGGTASVGGKALSGQAFTGSATVFGGRGYFEGGTAGNNLLQTDTGTGAATLVGGGSGDTLFNYGAKDLLIAGAGAETLVGTSSTAVGGSYFQTGGGNATVFGNAAGGNSFFLGNGISNITGSNGSPTLAGVHTSGNLYSLIANGGTDLVSDFVSGFDKFSLTNSVGAPTISALTFYTAGAGGSPFGSQSGTQVQLSDKTNIYFYNSHVANSDFS